MADDSSGNHSRHLHFTICFFPVFQIRAYFDTDPYLRIRTVSLYSDPDRFLFFSVFQDAIKK